MRVVKFPWVKHTEGPRTFEIYSVSVSPDGSRLATGGLDGKVKIWSIDTLDKYKEKEDRNAVLNPNECRPLSSMTRHQGAITCVRFSPNGRFLASGSDDKLVLIWEKDEEKTKIMSMHRNELADDPIFEGNQNELNESDLEHWTVRKRLVAHDNDVQDMAWAPDSSILVTVGLDRSIVVWNGMTFEKIKRFDIHQSHVKGVIFDPAGKYFATMSDDRSMRIFRYRKSLNIESNGNDIDFVVEHVIYEPFAKSPLTTYFRRSSWSPDGLYIAAPNGMNEGVNANVVIKRGSWENELSLIGHRLPCEVCSFSPRLYDPTFNDKDTLSTETVLITTGQDRSIALWSSKCATPLAVITEVSRKSLTDVAWNPNGLSVFICGLDGNIISLFFDEGELGNVVPLEENNKALIRYGKDRDMYFPESVEQLKLEEYAAKRGLVEGSLSESDRVDKKKSMLHERSMDSQTSKQEPNNVKMNILIPRSKKHPNKQMPVAKIQQVQPQQPKPESKISRQNTLSLRTQKVTITKSGKKRVSPMLISANSSNSGNTTRIQFTSSNASTLKQINAKKRTNLSQIMAVPFPSLPKSGLSTLVSSLRARIADDDVEAENSENAVDYIAETNQHKPPSSKSKAKTNGFDHKRNGNFHHTYDGYQTKRRKTACPSWLKNAIVNPITIYGEKFANDEVIIETSNSKDQVLEARFEYNNEYKYTNTNHNIPDKNWSELDSLSRLITKSRSRPNWEFFLNHKVSAIADSSVDDIDYWCLGTENGRILIISATGRQICFTVELGSNVVKLICHGPKVLSVCENGMINSWEFKNMKNGYLSGKSIVENLSLAPLINMHSTVTESRKRIELDTVVESLLMRDNACPLVVISHSDKKCIYTYDLGLEAWIEVFDNWYIKLLQLTTSASLSITKDRLFSLVISRIMRDPDFEASGLTNDKQVIESVRKSLVSLNEVVDQCINKRCENL